MLENGNKKKTLAPWQGILLAVLGLAVLFLAAYFSAAVGSRGRKETSPAAYGYENLDSMTYTPDPVMEIEVWKWNYNGSSWKWTGTGWEKNEGWTFRGSDYTSQYYDGAILSLRPGEVMTLPPYLGVDMSAVGNVDLLFTVRADAEIRGEYPVVEPYQFQIKYAQVSGLDGIQSQNSWLTEKDGSFFGQKAVTVQVWDRIYRLTDSLEKGDRPLFNEGDYNDYVHKETVEEVWPEVPVTAAKAYRYVLAMPLTVCVMDPVKEDREIARAELEIRQMTGWFTESEKEDEILLEAGYLPNRLAETVKQGEGLQSQEGNVMYYMEIEVLSYTQVQEMGLS